MKHSRRDDHKQAKLCAQVAEVASLALGAATDSRLQQLIVHSVHSSADGSKLIVHVVPTELANLAELEQLLSALDRARAWMRQQVAAEIMRKRMPDIAFQVLLNPDTQA